MVDVEAEDDSVASSPEIAAHPPILRFSAMPAPPDTTSAPVAVDVDVVRAVTERVVNDPANGVDAPMITLLI